MGDELNSREVYQFLRGFDHDQFIEFARNFLNLKDRQIKDIELDYSNRGAKEQRYQMIRKWRFMLGRRGTMEKLEELKRGFLAECGDNDDNGPIQAANARHAQVANEVPRPREHPHADDHGPRNAHHPPAGVQEQNAEAARNGPPAPPQQLNQNHPNQVAPSPRNGPVAEEQNDIQEGRAFNDPADELERLRIQ